MKYRKTKIIVTLGPSSWDAGTMEELIGAGIDAARINFSHGDAGSNRRIYRTFREACRKAQRPLPIIGDLQGPRIRVGEISGGSMQLEEGGEVVLSPRKERSEGNRIGTTYSSLARDVSPGDSVLLNDGLLRLTVKEVDGDDVRCRVEAGGRLSSHKGINLPGVSISEPAITERDREDLELMIEEGFDFVALSFVQRASDVRKAREIIDSSGSSMQIIAKIEKPAALDELDGIMEESDGVIVARGDLGVELGVERVPAAQKRILQTASRMSTFSVTATQLLESMTHNPVPTRAEASDVANAVFDGSDSLLFTGETAAGDYPVRTVRTADRIVREAEDSMETWGARARLRKDGVGSFAEAICHAAVGAALDLGAKAIVVGSQTGLTALLISKFQAPMPILGVSDNETALRRMNILRGIYPAELPRMESLEESVDLARKHLIESGMAEEGDPVVMTFGAPLAGRGRTNTLRLVTL